MILLPARAYIQKNAPRLAGLDGWRLPQATLDGAHGTTILQSTGVVLIMHVRGHNTALLLFPRTLQKHENQAYVVRFCVLSMHVSTSRFHAFVGDDSNAWYLST